MTREEQWLGAIAGLDGVAAPDLPVWHYEQMLAAIYDAVTGAADPRPFPERSWHLDEVLYAVYCAAAGLDDPGCPAPTCRIEEFWKGIYDAATGDDDASVPDPVWRIEEFLAGIFDVASGWGASVLTETGDAPLTLANAIARAIRSLTQTGLCTQASTPTPTSPVDIVCNNGRLAYGVYSTNLCNPAYYQGGGWYIGSNNTVTTANANATLLFPCRPNTTYSWWHTAGAGGCRAFELPTDTVTLGQEAYWAVGNPAYNDAMTVRKYTTSADAKLLCILFGRDAAGVGRTFEQQLADFMLVEGDISVPTQYEPYKFGLHTVGTPEVLTVRGKNLINEAACTLGIYVNPTTGVIEDNSNYYTTEKLYLANGTYTYSQDRSGSGATNDRLNIATYNADDTPIEVVYMGFKREEATVTLSGDYAYVRISYRKTNTDIMLEAGDTATAYQPYFTQTASVENLFAVGSYADTAELIHGLLTHKVGVKVLDGTEDWGQNTTYKRFTTQFPGMVSASPRSLPFLSTHFVTAYSATTEAGYIYNGANNTTVMITHDAADATAFKAWLAAQYKAGTPVMVFYPLAEATTESVEGQALHTAEGTNVVDVSANVGPVPLEVVYIGEGS